MSSFSKISKLQTMFSMIELNTIFSIYILPLLSFFNLNSKVMVFVNFFNLNFKQCKRLLSITRGPMRLNWLVVIKQPTDANLNEIKRLFEQEGLIIKGGYQMELLPVSGQKVLVAAFSLSKQMREIQFGFTQVTNNKVIVGKMGDDIPFFFDKSNKKIDDCLARMTISPTFCSNTNIRFFIGYEEPVLLPIPLFSRWQLGVFNAFNYRQSITWHFGSIKTIVGFTQQCANYAGVLAVIVPTKHFECSELIKKRYLEYRTVFRKFPKVLVVCISNSKLWDVDESNAELLRQISRGSFDYVRSGSVTTVNFKAPHICVLAGPGITEPRGRKKAN